jgi:5-hydroxyisourate hydrolase-like protein (transthyretin family)
MSLHDQPLPSLHHRPRLPVALAVAALCATVLGIAAARANAATYHAYLCRVPYGPQAGKPAPTDGTTYSTSGSYVFASQGCSGGGAMSAAMDGGTTHNFGEGATVTFTAPGSLTVAGFRVWRHVAVGPVQPFGAPATNLSYTGATSVEGLCAQSLGCTAMGNPGSPLDPGNGVSVGNLSGVTQVRWDATCGGGPGGVCPASGSGTLSAVYDVYAADMLLDDPAPPVVSGVGGPLLAGGTLAGAQSVSFNATDSGSGVHRGSLLVDGAVAVAVVLDDAGGACTDRGVSADGRPSFVNTQPCPPSVSGLLTLNTDALRPGAHELVARVADAAGNQRIVATATITVVGSLPPGTPNGNGASRAAKLTGRFATGGRTRRLSFTASPTVTGRLLDGAGKPITSAAVDVLVRRRNAGAATKRIATATTGDDGRLRVKLPSGPSRTITLSYTAFSGDPKPAATSKLGAVVRAIVSASITPRSVRLGQPLVLTGRLRHLRRGGVLVLMQGRDGRVWKTIGTVRTSRDGRLRWRYRFRVAGSRGATFQFRARVSSPNYPFAPGNSKPIRVHVR